MKVYYTLHALERMHQRGISRELVEECLRSPDKDEELEYARRCVKRLGNSLLVVIYRKIQCIASRNSLQIHKDG